ncbi:MAG: OadG family protein [Clostridiales bacterium]|nr:OadG family protein [Clostridiales bacterium]
MNTLLLSAEKITLAEGALYSVIGFIIVLVVLALLVGIFYLSGFVFQSKAFNKQKPTKPAATQSKSNDDETDEQLVAAITAAITCVLQAESDDGEAPEFVIKRITRKK